MNLILKLVTCILVYSAVNPVSATVTCGLEESYLSNPNDCSSYYVCAPGHDPMLMQCPLGHGGLLVFNNITQQCVHAQDFDCRIFACDKYIDPESCTSSPNNCYFCCDSLGDGIPRCNTYDNLFQAGCRSFDQPEYDEMDEPDATCVIIMPGEKRNITVTFTLQKHPLDFYYLMDTTGSMADDKASVIALSSSFMDTLANLTDDFHIGFGTFKDKPIFPSNRRDYSFRNDLPLTSQTENFLTRVSEAEISGGGGDGPEACSDALTQVVECGDRIGWRDNTRRVVLVATDDLFHLDGFGALFGITAPYVDGCYLDADGYYTETLTLDFPSIAQLAAAYSRTPVTTTVIFATSWGIDFYQEVAAQFKSAYVAELAADSSNVVELIKDEFARIYSKFEIDTDIPTDTVNFKYFSNCLGTDGERETAICENMPENGEVSFTVEIDLPMCPDNGDTEVTIDFNPVGLPVSVEVKLSLACSNK